MKSCFLIIILSIIGYSHLLSQDVIIQKNGNKIECKILREDSVSVYFTAKIKEKEINTFINRTDIESIQYYKEAQTTLSDTSLIKIEKKGLGYVYYSNDKLLTLNELSNILSTNSLANEKFESAKSTATFANIFACVGGFLIGYPLGTAMGGGKANWTLAGIGAGCLLVMIPIVKSAEEQAKEAVNIYNGNLKKTSMNSNAELDLGFTGNGVGLCLRF